MDIWALAERSQLQVGEFKVNMAAGLEDDLINRVRPLWNGRDVATDRKSVMHPESGNSTLKPNHMALNVDAAKPETLEPKGDPFVFQLRKTYYDQGFFNVGVNLENLFASGGAPIEIRLGAGKQFVNGKVNRSANKNNSPRIMGGVELRDWFQRNFEVDDPVHVDILSKTSIRLRMQK